MEQKLLFLLCLQFVYPAFFQRVDYFGHSVVRVRASNASQLQFLKTLYETNKAINFWSEPRDVGFPVDIHLTPETQEPILFSLSAEGLSYHIKVDNLGKAIQDERRDNILRRSSRFGNAFDLETYHPYEEIVDYLNEIALENGHVSTEEVGYTVENRTLVLAKIISPSALDNPIVFFDCGVHAREWAAPATCLWFINELATKYGVDSEITQLVDAFSWYIIPVANPDGYAYTWSTDRLWRKTRTPSQNISCYGVDLNRNFPVNFGGLGASALPCVDIYHGPASFSEAESQAIRNVIVASRPNVKIAISIHTYSQLWMSPYAYTHEFPTEYAEMLRVMTIGVEALQNTYGTQYQLGNHADTIYIASGTTLDYYYVEEGILHAYLLELRDTGEYGFELPASQIAETAIETWNGIKAMAFAILTAAA